MKFIKYSMISLAILAVSVLFYFVLTREKPVRVKLEAYYVAFACGDCGPHHMIRRVLVGRQNIKGDLKERPLRIEWSSQAVEDSVEKVVNPCWNCYDYIVYGDFYYQPKKDFSLLKVESYKLRKDKECCKEYRRATALLKTNTH